MLYHESGHQPVIIGVRDREKYGLSDRCRFVELHEIAYRNDYIETFLQSDQTDDDLKRLGDQYRAEGNRNGGYRAKIRCNKQRSNIAWDIRRIGPRYPCGLLKIAKHYTYTKETTEAFDTKVSASATYAGITASAEFAYHKSMGITESSGMSIECDDANSKDTCAIGAPALIELIVTEAWVTIPHEFNKNEDAVRKEFKKNWDSPNGDMVWYDQDNADKNHGMSDAVDIHLYSYNYDYEGAMDMWYSTGEDCSISNNRNWPANEKS